MKHVMKILKEKKIDKIWINSLFIPAIKKKFKHRTEWLIRYSNEIGTKGKNLYVFLTLSSEFVTAKLEWR